MRSRFFSIGLLALTTLSILGCEDLPDPDAGARPMVTLIALLEPGDVGVQSVLLTHPLGLDEVVNDTTAFLSGASLRLWNHSTGDSITLDEDGAARRYVFNRADLPLSPGDSVSLRMSGQWSGEAFLGEMGCRMVGAQDLAFTLRPNDTSMGYEADTLMFYDPETERNLAIPTAFLVDWNPSAQDAPDTEYQLEFNAVVKDTLSGEWISTPAERLFWLRDDREAAWQVGPYPDLRLPPGPRLPSDPPQHVSWTFFVFVDSLDTYVSDVNRGRRMGYYDIILRRLNGPAARFFFTTHWWIREEGYDPVDFNLRGENCQGVVGSWARHSFRVALVDDSPTR
jgi:hypothetical protein